MKKVIVENKRRLFDDFFKVDEVHVRYEQFDGHMSAPVRQLVFERGDSVAAILMHEETGGVILIKQFRYPTYEKGPGWIIEAVAGKLEDDELPEEAIRREIVEEVGYAVTDLTHISTFYLSPGGASERIILFLARVSNTDKIAGGGGLETENEDIQTITFSFPELWAALESGQIVDAKTLVGILWLKNRLAYE